MGTTGPAEVPWPACGAAWQAGSVRPTRERSVRDRTTAGARGPTRSSRASRAAGPSEPAASREVADSLLADLEQVVGGDEAWVTVPDLVDLLGADVPRVRRLLDDRLLVGVRRGRPKVLQVPRALADPEPLVSLPGTVTVLADAGYTDAEALRWLFTPDDTLGCAPVAALRAGRIAPVRRHAQVLLL